MIAARDYLNTVEQQATDALEPLLAVMGYREQVALDRARRQAAYSALVLVKALRAVLDQCDAAERNYGGSTGMANLEAWVHLGTLRGVVIAELQALPRGREDDDDDHDHDA
jgi:hypothetical protein